MAGSLVPVGITALLVPVSPADGAVPDEKPVLETGTNRRFPLGTNASFSGSRRTMGSI